MTRYLITGAAGFIGSAIAKDCIDRGIEVVTIDNLSTGFESNIPPKCEFIKGNCQDERIIELASKYKYDAIIHIAGQSSGEISFDDPVYDLQTNVQSTLLLLKLAVSQNCKKFIYASSMSVYGDQPDGATDENAPTVPKSLYAVGKLASENYMRIFSEMHGIECTALRFFNVYGEGQNLTNLRQGMASIFLAQAIQNKHIHVKGDKNRFRDFVYISDVVSSVMLVAEKQINELFNIYNVCNKSKIKVERVVDEIIKNLPYDVTCEYSGSTPGDQFGIYGDNKKIISELGWNPQVDFTKGISRMVDWAKNQNI